MFALGTVAAGGGTALATGAFSSVSADRTVAINTASDADAVLSLVVDDGYTGLDDGGGDVIELNFNQLNGNATTTFENALKIENNGSNKVDVSTNISETNLSDVLTLDPETASLEPDEEGDDDTVTITLIINLRDNTLSEDPDDITFAAATYSE